MWNPRTLETSLAQLGDPACCSALDGHVRMKTEAARPQWCHRCSGKTTFVWRFQWTYLSSVDTVCFSFPRVWSWCASVLENHTLRFWISFELAHRMCPSVHPPWALLSYIFSPDSDLLSAALTPPSALPQDFSLWPLLWRKDLANPVSFLAIQFVSFSICLWPRQILQLNLYNYRVGQNRCTVVCTENNTIINK